MTERLAIAPYADMGLAVTMLVGGQSEVRRTIYVVSVLR